MASHATYQQSQPDSRHQSKQEYSASRSSVSIPTARTLLHLAPADHHPFATVTLPPLPFAGLREYAISPLLISAHLSPSPFSDPSTTPPPSPHTSNLLPSALSGFLAGTAFSAFTRSSPSGAPRAGLTLALLTSLLQLTTNELGLARIHLLSWGEARRQLNLASPPPTFEEASLAPGQPSPPTYTREVGQRAPNVVSRETFSERSDRLIGGAWAWVGDRVGRLSPMKKMGEGEYVGRLEGRRREVGEERERVRREVEAVEKALGR